MVIGNALCEEKSAHRRAFEHYMRTGEQLTTAQWLVENERKYNQRHREDNGQFDFALGGSGGRAMAQVQQSSTAVAARSSSLPSGSTRPTTSRSKTSPTSASHSRRVSADHVRAVMPAAGKAADDYADPLDRAMTHFGIATHAQKAAFLAQVSHESGQLQRVEENLRYSAEGLHRTFPDRFPSIDFAKQFVGQPALIADQAYHGKIGNGNRASGDGYRYRGRGILQITGRDNYRALGYENDPDALSDPYHAAFAAAGFWKMRGLNERTQSELNRQQFDRVTGRINSARLGAEDRWQAYQRALAVLRPIERQ